MRGGGARRAPQVGPPRRGGRGLRGRGCGRRGRGEPPEGRHSRDRANPDFWRNQWQAIVATSILGVLIIIVVIIALLS